jgi:hypothetical protein
MYKASHFLRKVATMTFFDEQELMLFAGLQQVTLNFFFYIHSKSIAKVYTGSVASCFSPKGGWMDRHDTEQNAMLISLLCGAYYKVKTNR